MADVSDTVAGRSGENTFRPSDPSAELRRCSWAAVLGKESPMGYGVKLCSAGCNVHRNRGHCCVSKGKKKTPHSIHLPF